MGYAGMPIVGQWYRRADREQAFLVVAYDADAATVDVEYFDGTIDEWPLSHWHARDIEPCEPSTDWRGPFDGIETEDLGLSDSNPATGDWRQTAEATADTVEAIAD